MRIAVTPTLLLLSSLYTQAAAFPSYGSLAGLSDREIAEFARTADVALTGAQPAPGPLKDDGVKLIADAAHPYKAAGPNDIRGPCPGLNTLASHGYLPRNGIATPQQIMNAVQEGFNMGNDLALLVTFGAFLVDGNHLTNLMSIGQKTNETGTNPAAPAIVGGLNTHGVFEGDASTTRGDFYFGDNFSFNETLFQVFIDKSNTYGGGKYNLTAAAELRWARLQDSIARNPFFDFVTPRYFTAYAESIFPYRFFVDGRDTSASLNLTVARGFFQHNEFPADFHRRNGSFGLAEIGPDSNALRAPHPILPGHNDGAGNYVLDPEDPGVAGGHGTCYLYTKHVNVTTLGLYPNPTGALKKALQANAATFYQAVVGDGCAQVYPWGQ
ncbi:heme-thiolate peroxidase [Athelia psychrophila]|uniref:Heme-thiolate peroxidase n=1 Tax=Athelia psychrophila TaxID=1759441 RepID=A0A165YG24_9AGAM|nr:heme-thiolate peroxidase [Fibularhizoctonia sp. CBS 109695]